MSTITLDSIRAAADKKYGPTVIDLGNGESMTLRPALRLPREARKRLVALQEEREGAEVDDMMVETLRIVAQDPASVDAFLELIDHDLAVIAEVFEAYSKGTELGEASPSEN